MNKGTETHAFSRRGFLASIAAGTAVVASAPAVVRAGEGGRPAGAATKAAASSLEQASDGLRRALMHIEPGVGVLGAWYLANVRLDGGAVVLDLADDAGRTARVDVCRRDPKRHSGVERTDQFELVVMNDGEGSRSTPADLEKAIRIIAEVIRRQEVGVADAARGLINHEQRLALFQNGVIHCEPSRA
jgi:hypothetical protein